MACYGRTGVAQRAAWQAGARTERAGWLVAAAAAVGVLALPGPDARAAGLMRSWDQGGLLELRRHEVRVEIEDGLALTEVTQTFYNTEDRIVEALYVFPLPHGASLADFTMWIGGKEMVGEVVEKQRARRIYESYKPARRDPGLIEKVLGLDVFEMRIFPIGPKAEQKVRLCYYQDLHRVGDRLTYVYPVRGAAEQDRWYRAADGTAAQHFGFQLYAHARSGFAAIASPTHAALAAERQSPVYWRARMEQEKANLDKDVVVHLTAAEPAGPVEATTSRVDQADGFFRLLVRPPPPPPQTSGQDYVFLVDVSGSMSDQGRLDRARQLVQGLLDRLAASDRFEIIAMRCDDLARLFGRCEPAGPGARAKAAAFLAGLAARGSTWLCEGLRAGAACQQTDRPLKIVLASDGIFDLDPVDDLDKTLRGLPSACRLCYVPLTEEGGFTMLQQLMRKETGWCEPFPAGAKLEPLLARLCRRLACPVLYQPKLRFEGAEVYDLAPAVLPPMDVDDHLIVYGRYRRGGPCRVTIRGLLGSEQASREASLDLPTSCGSKGRTERMWACRLVQDLSALAAGQAGQPQQDTLWRIVRLGVGYSIVTDYTSLLVLENDQEFKRWQIERANALRVAFDREGGTLVRRQVEFLASRAQSSAADLRHQGHTLAAARRPAMGDPLQPVLSSGPQVDDSGANCFQPELPKPGFCGTPKNFNEPNLRWRSPRPRKILLGPGVKVTNVALRKPVTSSDPEPLVGELPLVTDGDKESTDGSFVELGPGKQWVQIDLGQEHLIAFLLFWHYGYRVYHDVIVQVSNDPEFIRGVTTVFNNDHDNSSGMGIGKDQNYIEDHEGEYVRLRKPLRARYVRLYSNGSCDNDQNHYTEVEVYAIDREQ